MRPRSLLIVALLAAACGGPATPTAAGPRATVATTPARTSETAARPAFLTVRLTDVRTGELFTLGGSPGKVVLGIAMAVW